MRYAKLQKKLGKATLALKDRMRYITLSKKFVLSAEDACKIAFASNHNRMQLALRFQVSKRTVRRTLLLSALTLLEVQMKQLHDFKDYVAEHRPDFGVTTIMWDETSQSLALDAAPGTRQQMSSTWSVLVRRDSLCSRLGTWHKSCPRVDPAPGSTQYECGSQHLPRPVWPCTHEAHYGCTGQHLEPLPLDVPPERIRRAPRE